MSHGRGKDFIASVTVSEMACHESRGSVEDHLKGSGGENRPVIPVG